MKMSWNKNLKIKIDTCFWTYYHPPNQEERINKANKLTVCKTQKRKEEQKMPKYGSSLQYAAFLLFDKQYIDMKKWANCKFEIELDDKNEKYIVGKNVVNEMEGIKKTLDDMVEEWEEYEEEDGEIYMIFDMDGYEMYSVVTDHDEYRNWIYEYEIDVYYDLIVGKLDEYYILVKAIEDEKAKIQLEKDVCVGVALALMRT